MRRAVTSFVVAAALAACATPYQPKGFAGGYSEHWVNDHLVQIDIEGNGFTSSEQVGEMALLRAAEAAQEHGWPYFRLVGDVTDTTARADMPSTQWTTTARVNPDGTLTARTTGNGFTSIKPGSRIYVGMHRTHMWNDPSELDAADVIRRLGPKYK